MKSEQLQQQLDGLQNYKDNDMKQQQINEMIDRFKQDQQQYKENWKQKVDKLKELLATEKQRNIDQDIEINRMKGIIVGLEEENVRLEEKVLKKEREINELYQQQSYGFGEKVDQEEDYNKMIDNFGYQLDQLIDLEENERENQE